jgi:predicted ATP-dependent protease
MLRADVVEAIKEGQFHVYAVSTVDEGMEILTGRSIGERSAEGTYPSGSINDLVDRRLRELNESMRGYYGGLLAATN